jgi:hypothetical protein
MRPKKGYAGRIRPKKGLVQSIVLTVQRFCQNTNKKSIKNDDFVLNLTKISIKNSRNHSLLF